MKPLVVFFGISIFFAHSGFLTAQDTEIPAALEPFFKALEERHFDIATEILSSHDPKDWDGYGPNMNRRLEKGRRPLHFAAKYGNSDLCIQIIRYGGDVNKTDNFGNTPLHIASQYGHVQCVATLALKGADINGKNESGQTPLHLAVDGDMPEAVAALVRLGADSEIKNSLGQTPLDLADISECKAALQSYPLAGKRGAKVKLVALWESVKDDVRWYQFDREIIEEMIEDETVSASLKLAKLRQLMSSRGIEEPEY